MRVRVYTGEKYEEPTDVWILLTPDEARDILTHFQDWAEEQGVSPRPGWHMHVTDAERELTVAVDPADDGRSYAG